MERSGNCRNKLALPPKTGGSHAGPGRLIPPGARPFPGQPQVSPASPPGRTTSSVNPGTDSAGTSLSECTAISARPSSKAVSSSFRKRPLPPISASERSSTSSPRSAQRHQLDSEIRVGLLQFARPRAGSAKAPAAIDGWLCAAAFIWPPLQCPPNFRQVTPTDFRLTFGRSSISTRSAPEASRNSARKWGNATSAFRCIRRNLDAKRASRIDQ